MRGRLVNLAKLHIIMLMLLSQYIALHLYAKVTYSKNNMEDMNDKISF